MLPDLPEVKRELLVFLMQYFNSTSRQEMGALKDCRVQPIFEGNTHGVERSTGDKEVNSLWEIPSETRIEPQSETLESIIAKVGDMAEQVGRQVEKNSFAHLDRTLAKAGQVIDARNKDIADALFEMFEKVEIPLGKDGKLDHSGMRFVCGSEMIEAMRKIEETPAMKAKFEQIMEEKERKAIAREANRKLVG